MKCNFMLLMLLSLSVFLTFCRFFTSASKDILIAVFEKKLYDPPQQFPRKMATGTVEAFIKYLEGIEIPKLIFIPCEHYLYETSLTDTMRIKEQW